MAESIYPHMLIYWIEIPTAHMDQFELFAEYLKPWLYHCVRLQHPLPGGRCVRFLEVELALLGTPAGEVLRLACLPRPLLDCRKACEPGLAAPPALSVL